MGQLQVNMILDYINMTIDGVNLRNVMGYYRRYDIHHNCTRYFGTLHGACPYALIRTTADDTSAYWFNEPRQSCDGKDHDVCIAETDTMRKLGWKNVSPSTKMYDYYLGISWSYLRDILTSIVDNGVNAVVDVESINSLVSYGYTKVYISPASTPELPVIDYEPTPEFGYHTLNTIIGYSCVLKMLSSGNFPLLQRVKQCDFCGRYFLPASLKRRFCREKCRNDYHNANR